MKKGGLGLPFFILNMFMDRFERARQFGYKHAQRLLLLHKEERYHDFKNQLHSARERASKDLDHSQFHSTINFDSSPESKKQLTKHESRIAVLDHLIHGAHEALMHHRYGKRQI